MPQKTHPSETAQHDATHEPGRKFYITTAIDYINGKPHIGHSYEKVVADVLARIHRFAADDTFFLTGTDEHGAKIAIYAKESGLSEQDFADKTAAYFKKTWDNLELSYDRFIRTTDADHVKVVEKIMLQLKESGFLYQGEYKGLYCVGHEAFITEKELIDGLCPEHRTKPELISEKNWFLKISAFKDQLASKIENGEFKIFPEQSRKEILNILKEGFGDVSVTRPNVKWGIPVPWDPAETVYVWPDALSNYLTGVGYVSEPEQFKKYWPADFHVVGRDIAKFHCIIWPVILMAVGLPLPGCVAVHGFFTLNGQKISKSLGNVIDPNDWVEKYGADAVRYFLLREVPFVTDGDVSEAKLRARYEGDLANGLGNLVSRLTNMLEKFSAGEVPEVVAAPMPLEDVNVLAREFRFHEALAKIWESIAWANQYIDEQKPWELAKKNPQALPEILSKLSAQTLTIAQKLAPFMPHTAERIRSAFEAGNITKINDLFPKLD